MIIGAKLKFVVVFVKTEDKDVDVSVECGVETSSSLFLRTVQYSVPGNRSSMYMCNRKFLTSYKYAISFYFITTVLRSLSSIQVW